jgi:transcriptional regulator with XRE-family HTH domain
MKPASARPEDTVDSSDELIANLGTRLRGLRVDQKLTLEMVASRANVSRAMISKIERGEKMPTVGVLVRVATALDVTLSALLGAQAPSSGIQLQRADACNRFTDPETGLVREVVFARSEGEDVELVRHILPGLQSTGTLAPYPVPTHKLVFSPNGPLVVKIGDETYCLEAGDSLRFAVTSNYSFFNPEQTAISYYLLMTRMGTMGVRNP